MKQFEVTLDLVVEAPTPEEAWHLAEYITEQVERMWQSVAPGVQSQVMECIISGCEELNGDEGEFPPAASSRH